MQSCTNSNAYDFVFDFFFRFENFVIRSPETGRFDYDGFM